MKIGELAKILGYDLVGDPQLEVTDISYADNASISSIALIREKKEILTTRACTVVTRPCFVNTEKTLLFTYDDIGHVMIKISRVLMDQGDMPDYSRPAVYEMKENGIGIGQNVTLGKNVLLEPNTFIGNDVTIGDDTKICVGVVIGNGTQIGKKVRISPWTFIGADSFFHYRYNGKWIECPGLRTTVVRDGVHIGSHCVIQRGTMIDTVIGNNCMIGNCIDIGHDVVIGNNCKIVSQSGIAGDVVIGDDVLIYGQAGVSNGVHIGNRVTVKAKTLVTRSVPDGSTVFGSYGRRFQDEMRLQAKIRRFFREKE